MVFPKQSTNFCPDSAKKTQRSNFVESRTAIIYRTQLLEEAKYNSSYYRGRKCLVCDKKMAWGWWLHPLSLWLHHSFHHNLLFSYAISIAKCWPLRLHFSMVAACPKGEFFRVVWAKSLQGPWLLLFSRCQDDLPEAYCIATALFLWAIVNPTIHHVKQKIKKKKKNQSSPDFNVCKDCLALQITACKEQRDLTWRYWKLSKSLL